MASSSITLLPRIPRIVQVGDQLVADVVLPNGSTATVRVDAADMFGGVVGALATLGVAVKALATPTLTLDPAASISTDGKGNVTHSAGLVTFAGPLAFGGLKDVADGVSPEPAPGSRGVYIEGGFLKCAI